MSRRRKGGGAVHFVRTVEPQSGGRGRTLECGGNGTHKMRLHLTDYHLERARVLLAASGFDFAQPSNSGTTPCLSGVVSGVEGRCLSGVEGNRQSARMHIAEAERLIKATGYHRRDKELAELQPYLQ